MVLSTVNAKHSPRLSVASQAKSMASSGGGSSTGSGSNGSASMGPYSNSNSNSNGGTYSGNSSSGHKIEFIESAQLQGRAVAHVSPMAHKTTNPIHTGNEEGEVTGTIEV
jgi:hypothetical protein